MTPTSSVRLALAAALLAPAWASAAERPALPPAVAGVIACADIVAAPVRLTCLDQAAAALKAAIQSGEVVAVEGRAIRQTQRENFGRARPAATPIAPGEPAQAVFEVTSAGLAGDNHWLVSLKDGGRWRIVDQTFFSREPRAGSMARIKKGALGSYFIEFDGQAGVRASRID